MFPWLVTKQFQTFAWSRFFVAIFCYKTQKTVYLQLTQLIWNAFELQFSFILLFNSEAREWRHDSDKTRTNKLEWWMILKISLRAKDSVPKTLVQRKPRLHSLYFPQKTFMFTETRAEFSNLHSIFRLRALRYWRYKKFSFILLFN